MQNLFVRGEYEYVQFGDVQRPQPAHPYRARRRRPEVLDSADSRTGGARRTALTPFDQLFAGARHDLS